MNIRAEIEDSPAVNMLLQKFLTDRNFFTKQDAEIFELICYELGDRLGDDEIHDELVFISEVILERVTP